MSSEDSDYIAQSEQPESLAEELGPELLCEELPCEVLDRAVKEAVCWKVGPTSQRPSDYAEKGRELESTCL